MKKLLCLVVSLALLLSLAGCSSGGSVALTGTAGVQAPVEQAEIDYTTPLVTDLATGLFANSVTDKNTLISPVSLIYALAMTANGAQDETLSAFESFFGTDMSSLNSWLHHYRTNLHSSERATLHMANAIWFRQDGFIPDQSFLSANETYYDAGIYAAPFDASTIRDINKFVKENTDGQIDKIIEKIEPENIMFLVNALSFDAKWASEYERNQQSDGTFTAYDGTQQTVTMLSGQEYTHLQDENTTGFVKSYAGGGYSFVALLPEDGVDIVDYARSLTGQKLTNLLNNPTGKVVLTKMPEFKMSFDVEMKDILSDMGLAAAFDKDKADLSGLGAAGHNLFISSVLHKTTITVDRGGTKAAAVTMVTVNECDAEVIEEPAKIYLDRPFVYMITDTATNTPIFMGMVLEIE